MLILTVETVVLTMTWEQCDPAQSGQAVREQLEIDWIDPTVMEIGCPRVEVLFSLMWRLRWTSGGWSVVKMTSSTTVTEERCHHTPSPMLSDGCSLHEGYLKQTSQVQNSLIVYRD